MRTQLPIIALLFAFTLFSLHSKAKADGPQGVPTVAPTVAATQAPDPKPSIPVPDRTPLPDDLKFELHNDNGLKTIWVSYKGTSQKISETTVLPKGTRYFHWLDADDHAVLAAQGRYDKKEFDELFNDASARFEAQGPGFYASLSPIDSASYGPRVLMGEALSDLTIAHTNEIYSTNIGGLELSSDKIGVAQRLRAIGVDGVIQNNCGTWMSMINVRTVQKLRNPKGADLLNALLQKDYMTRSQMNPIQAVQTFFQKGYTQQAPNDWTRAHEPIWDKLLRGEPLNDPEKAQIADIVNKANSFGGYINLNLGKYSKQDPHFQNLVKYLDNEAAKVSTPDNLTKVQDFRKQYDDYKIAKAKYWTSPEYSAYTAATTAYFASAYTQYTAALNAYNHSPAYLPFHSALRQYQKSPAYAAYQIQIQQYSNSPAWTQYAAQLAKDPKTPLPPGIPQAPPGAPIAPPNMPVMPDAPKMPPLPIEPDINQLTDAQKEIYRFKAVSDQIVKSGFGGVVTPDALPVKTPKEKFQLDRHIVISCIRTFFGM